jgi:flagellar biosynthetic protein FlhB
MADAPEQESKTEEATEKKIRTSIEKGNVPVSREAAIFASVVGILVFFTFFVKANVSRLAAILERFIDDPGGWSLDSGADASQLFGAVGAESAAALLPAAIVLTLAGVSASLLQNAPRVAVERIRPDLSRISPKRGWQRLFGRHGQTEFLKAALKFGGVAVIAVVLLRTELPRAVSAMFTEASALPELILAMAMRLLAVICVATVALVAADLVWARLNWRRDLRMTRQELKDELKDTEGDPLVRLRLRSLARDRARRRMIAAVPRATLVIANPTHFSVALRYVREEGGAPLVIAKGQDLIALKIREVAEAHGIAVVEDKALARSLYAKVEVDRMIPPEFYRAVAEIIHFLHARGAAPARAG